MDLLNKYIFACALYFGVSLGILVSWSSSAGGTLTKQSSVFYSNAVLEKIASTCKSNAWGQFVQTECRDRAEPWKKMSDEALWSLMFGPTISRSWMVWSDGYCPACKNDVRMYAWKIEPFTNPWQVQCPHCAERFPKNDFYAFYRSGLDSHGVFDPQLADRSLLFNLEHPQPADSLHLFGVDDGEGFLADGHRWRFIGAYLIYGQWKKLILDGILNLSAAYVLTGEPVYAHKTGILLDRIADLYPAFDYGHQAFTYEKQDRDKHNGYVSVWHDACRETRILAMAYDRVFDAIKQDRRLVTFLAEKAAQYQLKNPKLSFSQIQQNIESRILTDALENRRKIESNFPQTEITRVIIQTILGWPEKQNQIWSALEAFISAAAAVDGLSGEKGLFSYAALVPKNVGQCLALFEQLYPGFLVDIFKRQPHLAQMFRFHLDTWVNEEYYPKIGDCGRFGKKTLNYVGAVFQKNPISASIQDYSFSSMFTFFWQLYEITGDPAYVQLLYQANNNSLDGLPYDLLTPEMAGFQNQVKQVLAQHGTEIQSVSVNKSKWGLALLKSGSGSQGRAVWLNYSLGGNHCQADALNIGLFAKGLDLLPGFGYPPVQYGGWYSPKVKWYRHTASHNTVLVDGKTQLPGILEPETEPMSVQLNPRKRLKLGETPGWAIGEQVKYVRAKGEAILRQPGIQRYERAIALVELTGENSYVVDLFRVTGGREHIKFLHVYPGKFTAPGLSLKPVSPYEFDSQMKNFQEDKNPPAGWFADWEIEDFYGYLEPDTPVHLRYTDLTAGGIAASADSWIALGYDRGEYWIPGLMVRRTSANAPLSSLFAGILEPYNSQPEINSVQWLASAAKPENLGAESGIGVRVSLQNGDFDLILAADGEKSASARIQRVTFKNLETDAEFCLARFSSAGDLKHIFLTGGSFVRMEKFALILREPVSVFEIAIENDQAQIVVGDQQNVIRWGE